VSGTVLRSIVLVAALASCRSEGTIADPNACDPSIALPDGFCAQIVADSIGAARHIAVRANGDLFVALLAGRRDSGGVAILRDTTRDGRPDVVQRFGSGSTHGLALASDSTLYVSTADAVYRYRFTPEDLAPRGRVDTIVVGLSSRGPPSHSIALDARGRLIVNVGAVSTACAVHADTVGSPGKNPCPELETSGGLWAFDTGKLRQTIADGNRLATGLHNAIALAVNTGDTVVYAVSHGRDRLHESWPDVIDELAGATRAGEEMIRVASIRADYGWPYCYYDIIANKHVVAPEYRSDPAMVGRCNRAIEPLVAFPAHWSPMAMLFYTGDKFPAKYKDGVFVAFHGSAYRTPLPQEGYNVVFVPFRETLPRVDHEIFADGFAGGMKNPTGARHRPSGLAQGKDGALYVSDDKGGRVWRIVYRGH
jgi:glucose/arabinose dehydrogenase